jgi:hypothetical protein
VDLDEAVARNGGALSLAAMGAMAWRLPRWSLPAFFLHALYVPSSMSDGCGGAPAPRRIHVLPSHRQTASMLHAKDTNSLAVLPINIA